MATPVQDQLRDSSQDGARLRRLLLGLLLALLLPTSILAYRAYSQLGYESLYRYRLTAENVSQTIDAELNQWLAAEVDRSAQEYEFFLPGSDQPDAAPRRSPLADLSGGTGIAGALGYFQVDARGQFSSPLLPEADSERLGLAPSERQERLRRRQQIAGLLALLAESGGRAPARLPAAEPESPAAGAAEVTSAPKLAQSSSAEPPRPSVGYEYDDSDVANVQTNQRVFDRLVTQRQDEKRRAEAAVDDESVADTLSLKKGFLRSQKEKQEAPRSKALEQAVAAPGYRSQDSVVPKDFAWLAGSAKSLEYQSVDATHFLLFRRWWQGEQPIVQGVVVNREQFLGRLIDRSFERSGAPAELQLTLTENNEPIRIVNKRQSTAGNAMANQGGGELLYRARLPAPLTDLQLVYSAQQQGLPLGGGWIIWSSALMLALLLGGFALIYRFGLREIARRQTQQNFVSAVSHELKTPLTAIRMYGEMLKSGWVAEDKKPGYYEFIFTESERLSRLISNVLRLSQISRDRLALTLTPCSVAQVMDVAQSKLQSLAEQSGVTLNVDLPSNMADAQVAVDDDALAQVLINLMDNALKFGADGTPRQVDLSVQGLPSNLPTDRRELCLSLRDYGPGIPKSQLERIFELFYRGESELTRTTQGTGIGLALVAELVGAMHGRVEARNCHPGAQFSLYLPLQT